MPNKIVGGRNPTQIEIEDVRVVNILKNTYSQHQ